MVSKLISATIIASSSLLASSQPIWPEGNGNRDVDAPYTGSQDWDDWHHSEGEHEDNENWTGDINDFLFSEGDHDHTTTVWSFDKNENTIWDRLGDYLTEDHEHFDVDVDLQWVDWAAEDVDFWDWFWLWYQSIDETWTFDHEAGFVLTDPDYAWEWFQNHTTGFNDELDSIWIDTDDSEQWNWERWEEEYWNKFHVASQAPDGFMSHHN